MAFSPRSIFHRSLLEIGIEAFPWVGLAAVSLLLPTSTLEGLLPYPRLLLPLLVVLSGGLLIGGRRRWNQISTTALSAADPGQSSSPPRDDRSPRESPARQDRSSVPTEESLDPLTGLATRDALLNTLLETLEQNAEKTPALLTLRIHEYRDVTESFGHQAGQELLTAVASEIADESPPSATAARIAEDTFTVLLPQTEEEGARKIGRDLLQIFDEPFNIAGHPVPIEASTGLAVAQSPGSSFGSAEKMLQASYSAMHQVQRQGGTKLKVFQSGDGNGTRWLQRRERLRQAIRQDELTLHYQPVVHLVSGDIVGAEALVRWDHPERGLLSPAAFIPLAEETGLVGELDRWVFNRALEDTNRWTRRPNSPLDWVSVNISPQSVEGDLQQWCRGKLHEAALPPGSLHLEITERWALHDERSLQPLRDEGVRLSIDDFGTGYSSLRYLRSLNADVLKIDSEFVQDLGTDPKTTAIVQFLMNLSLRLDVEVIAEGVETAEQETILRELGCAMAQGYHFSRPIPADMLLERAGAADEPSTPPEEEILQPA